MFLLLTLSGSMPTGITLWNCLKENSQGVLVFHKVLKFWELRPLVNIRFKNLEHQFRFWNNLLQQTDIYIFKVGNRNTAKRCEKCSKLTIKTPKKERRSGVLVLTLHIFHISFYYFYCWLWTGKWLLGSKQLYVQIQQ